MIAHRMAYTEVEGIWSVWCETCTSQPIELADQYAAISYVMSHSAETSGTVGSMEVEWYGGPRDGELFNAHPETKQVEFQEWGRLHVSQDPDRFGWLTYRAPIAREYVDSQPTGRALVYYRYRNQVITADDLN